MYRLYRLEHIDNFFNSSNEFLAVNKCNEIDYSYELMKLLLVGNAMPLQWKIKY